MSRQERSQSLSRAPSQMKEGGRTTGNRDVAPFFFIVSASKVTSNSVRWSRGAVDCSLHRYASAAASSQDGIYAHCAARELRKPSQDNLDKYISSRILASKTTHHALVSQGVQQSVCSTSIFVSLTSSEVVKNLVVKARLAGRSPFMARREHPLPFLPRCRCRHLLWHGGRRRGSGQIWIWLGSVVHSWRCKAISNHFSKKG